jgi:lipopolysaccharide transport system ATP-binding protein
MNPLSARQGANSPLIRLDRVGKAYPILQSGAQQLALVWARLRGHQPGHVFQALQDVSFEIMPGQSMGLVGVNGAGKSTLLKIMAGVVRPTEGAVQRRGRVSALLELGAGFHPDYTGRANIDMACALMGLSREETRERIDSILAFADIGVHIDQPVKHYSSGMVVRLGFAVATSVVPDVLITDEVLAVGDESFQKKCIAWMERYLAEGGTLLLCSHSMYHIQKLCQRAVWIDQGRVRMLDEAQAVVQSYLAWHEEGRQKPQATHAPALQDKSIYRVESLLINGVEDASCHIGFGQGHLKVKGTLYSPDDRAPQVSIGIVRADGTPVYGVVSEMDGYRLARTEQGLYAFHLEFTDLPLLPGRYVLKAHAMDPEGMRLFDVQERPFEIKGVSRELGLCRLRHEWT